MRVLIKRFLMLVLCGLACGGSVWAVPDVRLIYADPAGSPMDAGARVFQRELEQRTGGTLHVVVLPGGVLRGQKIGELDMLRRTRTGEVEMCIVATAPITNFSAPMQILDMPFLFNTYDDVYRLLDGPLGQALLARLSDADLTGLAFMDCGFRILTCNAPLKSLQDLQGKKIRIMQSPIYYSFMKLVGAVPVPSAFDKINDMAAHGYIDAADRSYTTWWEYGLNHIQHYILETNHAYAAEPLVMNARLYRHLSASQQTAVRQAAHLAMLSERRGFREEERRVKARCGPEGFHVYLLSAADRDAMRTASAPIRQHLEEQYPDLMKLIR